MKKINAIGLMSGTSLDGVDVTACTFSQIDGQWSYSIHAARTYPYPQEWSTRLASLPHASALDFCHAQTRYGQFLGSLVNRFIKETDFLPDLVASHGHTIFHQPEHGLTVQLGSGSAIAAETGLPVVGDFRTADVALGGQGAPLVPIGDRLLFGEYGACLNLGGFANISFEKEGRRVAYDICPVNIVLNLLAGKLGFKYDDHGAIAASGKIDTLLLHKLNSLGYYSRSYPKSLGREWVEKEMMPLLGASVQPVENLLRTLCAHIAGQINRSLAHETAPKVLVTGGGAHNDFLMEEIRNAGKPDFIITTDEITDFKEALIFAFLGTLRWSGENNVLCSVTGSRYDHSGGAVWQPIPPPLPPGGSRF